MGRPKGLLPWVGKPLLRHQVNVLLWSGVREIAVILGEGADDLEPLIDDDDHVRTIWNARHASGRSSSAIIGAQALGGYEALMFCNLDQPLSLRLVEDLLRGAAAAPYCSIAVATLHGRRGHPVLIRRSLFPEVSSISESSEGLKAVIKKDPTRVLSVPTDSPNARLTFNTLDEYELAVQRLIGGELDAD